MPESKNVASFLLDNGVVGVKPDGITLKSGRTSHWYANARNLSTSVELLDKASGFIIDTLDRHELVDEDLDAFVGVPEGATELGIAVNEKLIRAGLIDDKLYPIRVNAKSHGDPSGMWKTGNKPGKIVIYEDVGTTLDSALKFADKLRKSGVEVEDLVVLVNRMQLSDNGKTIEESAEAEGLKLFSLTDANAILPELLARLALVNPELAEKMRETISQEYRSEYEEAGRESPIEL